MSLENPEHNPDLYVLQRGILLPSDKTESGLIEEKPLDGYHIFSDETIDVLARDPLTKDPLIRNLMPFGSAGQSIKKMRSNGRIGLWTTWHRAGLPEEFKPFEDNPSMQSQILINPKAPFLKDTNYLTEEEQDEEIREYKNKIVQIIPKVGVIMLEVYDYADILFTILEKTGRYVFTEQNPYIRTKTRINNSEGVIIGGLKPEQGGRGMGLFKWRVDDVAGILSVIPGIVPESYINSLKNSISSNV